jgi:hypothetical protein
MNNKKKTVSIITSIVILGSLFATTQTAYAANPGFGGSNFFSNFIEFISQKLGLDKAKVQSVVQEYQKQVKANITPRPTMSPQARQDAEKKRLNLLVTQGKITGDQENLILAELAALSTKYKFDSSLTPDKRKSQMTTMQNELKQWAQDNKIDPQYVLSFGRGRGFGEGKIEGGMRGRGPRLTVTP